MPRDVTINDFGLVIAYLLPGFSAVLGTAVVSGGMDWDILVSGDSSLGGIFFTIVLSVGAGMTLNLLRALLLDPLHHATGLQKPERNFAALGKNLEAYTFLNDSFYRHYQHVSGMLLATAWVYGVWRWVEPLRGIGFPDLGFLLLALLYLLASRDTLRKFLTVRDCGAGDCQRR